MKTHTNAYLIVFIVWVTVILLSSCSPSENQTDSDEISAVPSETVQLQPESAAAGSFRDTGYALSCNPAEGSTLDIVSTFSFKHMLQQNYAAPDPLHPITLDSWNTAYLYHNDSVYETDLGRRLYGGTYHWSTGELQSNHTEVILTGLEYWKTSDTDTSNPLRYFYCNDLLEYRTVMDWRAVCTHFPTATVTASSTEYGINVYNSAASNSARVVVRPDLTQIADLASWKAFLMTQYQNGTPVTIIAELTEPKTFYLDSHMITAQSGINTVSSNATYIQVSGIAYPTDNPTDSPDTKHQIFGIRFDTSDPLAFCTRVFDAQGKSVENNSFDTIFPWSEMRRCCISVNRDGISVIYENQKGFAPDGTAGNVMVEIPAFYVRRERSGTEETWLISGEAHDGFVIHPWFVNEMGEPVSHRYYGAYEATVDMADSYVFSHSGSKPMQYGTEGGLNESSEFSALIAKAGYQRNHIYAWSAIQYLFCIEYASLNSQSIMNGITYSPYFSGTTSYLKAENVGETTNTVKVRNLVRPLGSCFTFFNVGQSVCLGSEAGQVSDYRTIVSKITSPDYVYFTLDGEPFTVSDDLYCYPTAQKTGMTDSNMVHTGIAEGQNEKTASFKWRGIENPWGNIWELLDGIRISDGAYYITSPEYFSETEIIPEHWTKIGYAAPMVTATDTVPTNRIIRMGYDPDLPWLCLPDTLSSSYPDAYPYLFTTDDVGNYFFGDAFYSYDNSKNEYLAPFVGGGWDHHENAGLFCIRFLNKNTPKNWLYGERIVY